MKRNILIALLLAVLAVVWTACGGGAEPEEAAEPETEVADTGPVEPAPGAEQLANLTYTGLEHRSFTLQDGAVEQDDVRVELLEGLTAYGDLDGVTGDEAAVLLQERYGEAKYRVWLAAVTVRGGEPVVHDALLVAENEQLRLMTVSDNWIHVELIAHDDDDEECCPTEEWIKEWAIVEGKLQQVSAQPAGVLSAAALGGYSWKLTRFEAGDPAPETPEITILFKDIPERGVQLKGNGGCTLYFSEVIEEAPGVAKFGTIGMVARSCAPDIMELESKYLTRLKKVVRYGFWMGQLALVWEADGIYRTMLFERGPWPEE